MKVTFYMGSLFQERLFSNVWESLTLNTVKCWQLWDSLWCLFSVTLRTKLLMMGSPTVCSTPPNTMTAQSSVLVEVIILFMEHNNLQYFSDEKEQILPLLVQFTEQNSTALLFYRKNKTESKTHWQLWCTENGCGSRWIHLFLIFPLICLLYRYSRF